jgi:hypothetical protein
MHACTRVCMLTWLMLLYSPAAVACTCHRLLLLLPLTTHFAYCPDCVQVCVVCMSEPLSSSSSRPHQWRGYSMIRSCSQFWTATPTLAMAADRCAIVSAENFASIASLWYASGRGALPGANNRSVQRPRSLGRVGHLPASHV